jgi:cytochrome P450
MTASSSPVAPAPLPDPPRSNLPLPPGPRGHLLWGVLAELRRDPLRFFVSTARDHGDVVLLPFGPSIAQVGPRVILLARPEHIQRVFLDNQHNYGRQTRGYRALRETLGNGLVTSDGEFWLRQRRIAQPAFHRSRIAGFGAVMSQCADDLVRSWERRALDGQAFDVVPELLKVTLAILGRSMFRGDLSRHAEDIGHAVEIGLSRTRQKIQALVPIPDFVPTPDNLRARRAKDKVDRLIFDLIAAQRRGGQPASGPAGARDGDVPADLLTMLMEARDEVTGEGMTDVQLRDELLTILVAGHETTSVALAWTFMLLSQHPGERRRLEAELHSVLGGRPPTMDDLPRLRFTRMVLEESMRLYPPAWNVARSATQGDEIGGYRIPRGCFVLTSPYVTHRHPGLWENPEGFDPDRFDPARKQERHRFAYFPFGGGPHLCIGMGFAMMEAQLVLAAVAQRYRLELEPGHPLVPEPMVTLRPRHGVVVRLRPVPPPEAG